MLRKIVCMLSLLLLPPVLIVRGGADTNIKPPIPFTIHTHGVALTEENIKAVLDEVQDILTNNKVTISFDTTDSFDSHHQVIDDGKISGCDGIKLLLSRKDVNVHIVDDIPCCGHDEETGDKIVGCSGHDMAIFVLSPASGDLHLTAIQWMHELGHHMGLCHNVSEVGSIMDSIPGFTSDSLDECERLAFNGGVPSDPKCKPICSDAQQ